MIVGKCLCGDVEFVCNLESNPLKIYQCHCSLCKKQTGSSANSATIISATNFKWTHEGSIKTWQKDTGYNSHFCDNCGSPVPNLFAKKYYWIPVGLLELNNDKDFVQVAVDFCLSAKSSWHKTNEDSVKFEKSPNLDTILKLLGTG